MTGEILQDTIIADRELTSLLDVRAVDFSNIDEAVDFATLVCQSASHGGMFLIDGEDTKLLDSVRRAAKGWIKYVRLEIASMPPGDALEVIHIFDAVHRVAYGMPADPEFINKYTLKAFDARIHGDRSVNEYTLFRQISSGIRRHDRAYLDRPLEWHTISIERWYQEFTGLSRFTRTIVYDTIQKVNMLIESDLWAYETQNQLAFKRQLFNHYRDLIDNSDNYDLPTLKAFRNFVVNSLSLGYTDEYSGWNSLILRRIINHPSSTTYQRATLSLQARDMMLE